MDPWLKNMMISAIATLVFGTLLKLIGNSISNELGIITFFGFWITLNQNNHERKNKVTKTSKDRKTSSKE